MNNIVAWLRWAWRNLTSMRTALFLLFILAIASVPGSTFPQRSIDQLAVNDWLDANPTLGPILDALGMFDVFGSPWFAATYLLLIISLVGCVLPRSGEHARAMLAQPPVAPRRLTRLPFSASAVTDASPDDVLDRAEAYLRASRWRVRREGDWISAEKGYLHETGNLLFHATLILIILAVGLGGAYGYEGRMVIREGEGFSSTQAHFDEFRTGVLQDASAVSKFSFVLNDFVAEFQRGGQQSGAPRDFEAKISLQRSFGAEPEQTSIRVNEPLRVGNANVYLVGHGYAPRFTIRDREGRIVFSDTVVFLPQDATFTSIGVIKVPDMSPQLGLEGVFTPTTFMDPDRGPISLFPAPDNPAIFLVAFSGDLGLDSGVPQNVYRLETDRMVQLGIERVIPGQTWDLPGQAGSVTFEGVERWASFVVSSDPGQGLALGAAVAAMLGLVLSLSIHQRRIFLRVARREDARDEPNPDHDGLGSDGGSTLIEVGGLARLEAVVVDDQVRELLQAADPSATRV